MPLDNAAAAGTPSISANSRSNASTCGPSGAIQLESNASSNSARSVSPTSGGDRNRRPTGRRYPSAREGAGYGGRGFHRCQPLPHACRVGQRGDRARRPLVGPQGQPSWSRRRAGRGHDPRSRGPRLRDARRRCGRASRGPAVGATLDRRSGRNAPRERDRHGRGARSRAPGRVDDGNGSAPHRGVVVIGLRRQPHAPQARGPRDDPDEPVRREQARHRGLRARIPALVRAAGARVPVLQRVRSAPGRRSRVRSGRARLRHRGHRRRSHRRAG